MTAEERASKPAASARLVRVRWAVRVLAAVALFCAVGFEIDGSVAVAVGIAIVVGLLAGGLVTFAAEFASDVKTRGTPALLEWGASALQYVIMLAAVVLNRIYHWTPNNVVMLAIGFGVGYLVSRAALWLVRLFLRDPFRQTGA